MDEDFFADETQQNQNHNIETNQEVQPEPENNVKANEYVQHHQEHDEFDFGETQYEAPQINILNSYSVNRQQSGDEYGSYLNSDGNEILNNSERNKIREEEDRIQNQLRDKANQEYELKNKRKEQGTKQLEEFQHNKEQEAIARKQSNRTNQSLNSQESSMKEGITGWRKVADNVQLKQSENQGKKNISRMREAIVNKKSDDK